MPSHPPPASQGLLPAIIIGPQKAHPSTGIPGVRGRGSPGSHNPTSEPRGPGATSGPGFLAPHGHFGGTETDLRSRRHCLPHMETWRRPGRPGLQVGQPSDLRVFSHGPSRASWNRKSDTLSPERTSIRRPPHMPRARGSTLCPQDLLTYSSTERQVQKEKLRPSEAKPLG